MYLYMWGGYICTCLCISVNICIYIYIYICVCIYIYKAGAATTFSSANRCERGDRPMCVCVARYILICIYICVYMHGPTLVRRLPSLRLIDAKEVGGLYVYSYR